MLRSKRLPTIALAFAALASLALFYFWFNDGLPTRGITTPPLAAPEEIPPGPRYKDKSEVKVQTPISDNFPLLAGLKTGPLPSPPSWNKPPATHVPEKTPLFIGFTRNWPLLQQCVLSYITAGWPPEDIYVVDNTGTMKSNFPPQPKLTLQNPFYLDVPRLTDVFGVNVISTPTLLTFAQLQNFYLFTSLEKGWDYYFWGHMDIIVLTEEKYEGDPFRSFYMRAVDKLREASSPNYLRQADGTKQEWGIHFFSYDWLALNNVKSFMKIGGWDTSIGFYKTDCDMHSRFTMAGIKMPVADAGRISDVGSSIDLNLFFRRKIDPANPPKTVEELNKLPQDDRGGPGFEALTEIVDQAVQSKLSGEEIRNSWHTKQTGGQGEPFYRDPQGFDLALQKLIACGEDTYNEKWGHRDCELIKSGLKLEDAWQVEHDWE